jgi:uncharacterized membrane protein YgcG
MTHSIKTITSLFTLLVMSAFTTQVNADEYHHIDQLAVKIQRTAKRLLRETVHYRHTAEYGHMVADANEIYRLATHVHKVTHFEGNLNHLQNDVDELDRQFHHLNGVFDRIEHNAAYGSGHVHGNTAHVKRLLDSIEDSIHHMTDDLQEIRKRTIVARPVYTRPVLRPVYGGVGAHGSSGYGHGGRSYGGYGGGHGSHNSGFGFSFGGGSSRINIRF